MLLLCPPTVITKDHKFRKILNTVHITNPLFESASNFCRASVICHLVPDIIPGCISLHVLDTKVAHPQFAFAIWHIGRKLRSRQSVAIPQRSYAHLYSWQSHWSLSLCCQFLVFSKLSSTHYVSVASLAPSAAFFAVFSWSQMEQVSVLGGRNEMLNSVLKILW